MSSTANPGAGGQSGRRGITGIADKLDRYDRHEWWAQLAVRYLKRHASEYEGHRDITRIIGEIHSRRYLHTNEWHAVLRILCEDGYCMAFVRGRLYQISRDLKAQIDALIIDNRTTQLYRHFDKNGVLLYVGISLNAVNRLAQHRKDAGWFLKIARIDIENHSSLGAALHAERTAIEKESPLYNRSRIAPGDGDPITVIEKLCRRYAINSR